jgi:hypothetical protein
LAGILLADERALTAINVIGGPLLDHLDRVAWAVYIKLAYWHIMSGLPHQLDRDLKVQKESRFQLGFAAVARPSDVNCLALAPRLSRSAPSFMGRNTLGLRSKALTKEDGNQEQGCERSTLPSLVAESVLSCGMND